MRTISLVLVCVAPVAASASFLIDGNYVDVFASYSSPLGSASDRLFGSSLNGVQIETTAKVNSSHLTVAGAGYFANSTEIRLTLTRQFVSQLVLAESTSSALSSVAFSIAQPHRFFLGRTATVGNELLGYLRSATEPTYYAYDDSFEAKSLSGILPAGQYELRYAISDSRSGFSGSTNPGFQAALGLDPVPEPSSLLALGSAVVLLRRRKRRA